MLFVSIGKAKASTAKERVGRRAQWDYPPGINLVAEYWVMGSDINVVSIVEADNVAPIMATISAWDDVFDWEVSPALTLEEGLSLAQQMQG